MVRRPADESGHSGVWRGEQQLLVDTHFLTGLGRSLRTVALEFEHANARSDQAQDAVGHHELGEHVHDFAHNWDDTRKDMMGSIQNLAESAEKVGEQFDKVDTELMSALKGDS